MSTPYGLRKVKVFDLVPANTEVVIDDHRGAYGYIEVTNTTASPITIQVNDYPSQGMQGVSIPIGANATRPLPLQTYKFKATAIVTVVAYGA